MQYASAERHRPAVPGADLLPNVFSLPPRGAMFLFMRKKLPGLPLRLERRIGGVHDELLGGALARR